jgi:hypothetical protein
MKEIEGGAEEKTEEGKGKRRGWKRRKLFAQWQKEEKKFEQEEQVQLGLLPVWAAVEG